MASRETFLPFNGEPPSSNFPQLTTVNNRPVLAFDASTDETMYWTFIAPQGLTGTLTLVLYLSMASATSGAVGFQAQVEAVTPLDALNVLTTASFDTVNNSASTTVPGSTGYDFSISITLTNADNIAAGDLCRISLNRDADGSAITDSATGDANFYAAELRDAA